MSETQLAPRATRCAAVVAALAVALAGTEATADATIHGPAQAPKRHHAKKHAKHKKHVKHSKHAKKATAPAAAPAATRTTQTCSSSPGLVPGTTGPFEQHFDAAHVQRSPAEQVQDAGDASTYAKVHVALVQAMAQPSLSQGDRATTVLQQALAPFLAHLNAAHLEQSPAQQAAALLDPDTYALNHTVLVEQMLAPVAAWVQAMLAGERTCSTTTDPSSTPQGSAEPRSVDIHGHMYMPQDLSVAPGTKVTWANSDSDPHDVVADGGAFKSKTLEKGQSYEFTFSSTGTFTYYCSIHPDMKGKVTVG
jgi:plastocyanin